MFFIKTVQESDKTKILQFLNVYEETSQFLITNMRDNGLAVTSHPNSGNYKAVYFHRDLIGVYCLTKRGNLLIQGSTDLPGDQILDDCEQESHVLKGFIGDWSSVNPLYKVYRKRNPNYQPSYFSKEFLYQFHLIKNKTSLRRDPQVRLLEERDFTQWLPLSKSYREELNIPNDLTDEGLQKSFNTGVENQTWWGLFEDGRLISKANLNSRGEKIGQVGGVFTEKSMRQRGFSKRTMIHMLNDCIKMHCHEKSILFTGESDIPAQKLYESIGYKKIGYFALILSE